MTDLKTSESATKRRVGLPVEQTSSHIPVRPLYPPADLAAWDWNYDRDTGYPGEFPYTRGVQATMYRGRLWTMRQYAGMGDAEESNKRYKYLLAHGTTGLSVAFDLPTQIGLDSDNPLAAGEVGKVGVAIDSIEDMQRLFDGIDLTAISTSMTINATASILLALYVAVARRQGRDIRRLSGTVQNDVLKEYIARGTYIYPPQQAMRIITDVFAWSNENVPEWNTISISGYHMREAGSTDVGKDYARPLPGEESKVVDAAFPRADRRFDADGAATGEQHCPDRDPGDGSRPRRHAVLAYEFV